MFVFQIPNVFKSKFSKISHQNQSEQKNVRFGNEKRILNMEIIAKNKLLILNEIYNQNK